MVLERIVGLEDELRDVEIRLADPSVRSDPSQLADLGRRYKQLEEVVGAGRRLRNATEDLAEFRQMLSGAEGDERAQLRTEIEQLERTIEAGTAELRTLLVPRDPYDDRNVIIEIRGAAGGEEANLFARDLFSMYSSFARHKGWRFEMLGASPSDMGGYSDVVVLVSGDSAWTRLKHEAGTHRVQRVPIPESQGRVHTSSATVSVLPEAEEVEVDIDDSDLKVEVFRASGPGGQSVNTTDSAVRVTHVPSGMVVSMQDEKSQLQNKAKAMRVLRSRLLQMEQDKTAAQQSEMRRGQVGGGDRSEKIRTYNFKENRVTDHRIGLTTHNLDRVLAGDLDEINDALVAEERRGQLEDET
jgi:peptide chain release factor 1